MTMSCGKWYVQNVSNPATGRKAQSWHCICGTLEVKKKSSKTRALLLVVDGSGPPFWKPRFIVKIDTKDFQREAWSVFGVPACEILSRLSSNWLMLWYCKIPVSASSSRATCLSSSTQIKQRSVMSIGPPIITGQERVLLTEKNVCHSSLPSSAF